MKFSLLHSLRYPLLCLGLLFLSVPAPAQKVPELQHDPINLDDELAGPVKQDRAASYYHYSLSKLAEDEGDMSRALSEMRIALKYNPSSPSVHLELAALLEKSGNTREAITTAQEAVRLNPADADPHWLLWSIYFRHRDRGVQDGMDKAVQELQKLKELTPNDERVYYALGGAYFSLNQPDKAIEAYEKFQSLSSNVDNGYREIAKYFQSKGDREKTIQYLQKALEAQPDSAESLAMLGSYYAKTNKNREAVETYRKLAKLTGSDPNLNFQMAASLIELNEFDEALKVLDEMKDVPQNAQGEVSVLRGKALLGQRKYPEAIKALRAAIETDPGLIEAHFFLGKAYEDSGAYAEAVKVYTNWLSTPADSSDESKSNRLVFQQHLAYTYFEMKDYDKAVAVLQDMMKADPVRATPLLIDTYRSMKQYDKALALAKQEIDKDPKKIDMGLKYARILADSGRAKEGAETLVKMLEANPGEVDIYILLSQIYIQDKRYGEAEKVLRRAEGRSQDKGNTERLRIQQAQVYDKQKDFDKAESVLKDILKANPQNADALNYIGYLLADRGVRLEEAVRYVKEALALDPKNGAYLDSLGWAFFKLNDFKNAEMYLLQASETVKDDPVIEEHLGDLYFRTGNLDKAQEFWKRSISIGTEPEDIQKVRKKLEDVQQSIRKQKPTK